MKSLKIFLFFFAFSMVACADKGTSDGQIIQKAQVETDTTSYQKAPCGESEACSAICDADHPFLGQARVEEVVCANVSIALSPSSLCSERISIDYHDYRSANSSCKTKTYVDVFPGMDPMTSKIPCSMDSDCKAVCYNKFTSLSATEAKRSAGANTREQLYVLHTNFMKDVQLEGCLNAPADWVMGVLAKRP